MQQYMIVAVHKHLDDLEKDGKPHTRQSKELDKMWLKQIRDAQKEFKERNSEKDDSGKKLSFEEKMKKDQKDMINKIINEKQIGENG